MLTAWTEMKSSARYARSAGLEYVLIGAAAMAFHGLVRATQDLDLFIRATPENIEKLRSALRAAYEGDPNIDDISTTDLLGEYPAIRYVHPRAIYFST
jgi:predicted nucleotidyltransferase